MARIRKTPREAVQRSGSPGERHRQDVQASVSPATESLTIYFDGACIPVNPGGTATGAFRILTRNGEVVHSDKFLVCRGPVATNNVAEWAGLLATLRWVRAQFPGSLHFEIRGDSQLVIHQLNGRWRCQKAHLQPY